MKPAPAAVLEVEPEMLALEDLRRLAEHHSADPKHGLGVALAEGVQRLQLSHELLVQLAGLDPRRQRQLALANASAGLDPDRLGKLLAEGR